MKLHNLSMRQRFYQENDCYKLFPIWRQAVVPGQSGKVIGEMKMQTAAFNSNLLSDALVSVFFFYVPNRLVWDQWVDFISQDDTAPTTVPTTTTDWPLIFERDNAPANYSSLYRRAFKLVYNEFFGDEEFNQSPSRTWYTDISDDTFVEEMDILNTEQFSARIVADAGIASPTYDATTVPIDLNDFYKQMISARSSRKAQMSGDKYVDTLRRMGVEPDWRIQNAPEFLFRKDVEVKPSKTFSTSGTLDNNGLSSARFETTVDVNPQKNFFFAEHGYIVGVACVRPHVFSRGMDTTPDSQAHTQEDFFLGDNLKSQDVYNERMVASQTVDEIYTQRFSYLRNGIHMYGGPDGSGTNTWVATINPDNYTKATFVDGPSLDIVSTELESGEAVAALFKGSFIGKTPVPKNSI